MSEVKVVATASCPMKLREYIESGSFLSILRTSHVLQKNEFSEVSIVRVGPSGSDNERYVLKTYYKNRLGSQRALQVRREVESQMKLEHPNIIALYCFWETPDTVHLITEYADGGDLFAILYENAEASDVPPHSERRAQEVARQMLLALAYLHDKGIIHRDVKLENTFASNSAAPSGPTFKLGDLGFSINMDRNRPSTRLGTLEMLSPELLKASPNESYGAEVDIWALGIVVYEVMFGDPPFPAKQPAELQAAIQKGLTFPANASPGARAFISRCLEKDGAKRPSAKELLLTPWVHEGEKQRRRLMAGATQGSGMKSTLKAAAGGRASSSQAQMSLGPASSIVSRLASRKQPLERGGKGPATALGNDKETDRAEDEGWANEQAHPDPDPHAADSAFVKLAPRPLPPAPSQKYSVLGQKSGKAAQGTGSGGSALPFSAGRFSNAGGSNPSSNGAITVKDVREMKEGMGSGQSAVKAIAPAPLPPAPPATILSGAPGPMFNRMGSTAASRNSPSSNPLPTTTKVLYSALSAGPSSADFHVMPSRFSPQSGSATASDVLLTTATVSPTSPLSSSPHPLSNGGTGAKLLTQSKGAPPQRTLNPPSRTRLMAMATAAFNGRSSSGSGSRTAATTPLALLNPTVSVSEVSSADGSVTVDLKSSVPSVAAGLGKRSVTGDGSSVGAGGSGQIQPGKTPFWGRAKVYESDTMAAFKAAYALSRTGTLKS